MRDSNIRWGRHESQDDTRYYLKDNKLIDKHVADPDTSQIVLLLFKTQINQVTVSTDYANLYIYCMDSIQYSVFSRCKCRENGETAISLLLNIFPHIVQAQCWNNQYWEFAQMKYWSNPVKSTICTKCVLLGSTEVEVVVKNDLTNKKAGFQIPTNGWTIKLQVLKL